MNLIAALDYYIHKVIIWGLVQITFNEFTKTQKYKEFKISIEYIKKLKEKENEDIFSDEEIREEIIESIQRLSYQKWKNIKKGLEWILPLEILQK